ncbi:IST1-like protein [Drosera capensis]
MRKKLDALLGKSFKPARFKALLNLAVSRLAVFKNQHQVRCNLSHLDVIQLLNLGHHDSALIRVELVIKEQNMLDAFVMMEGYCNVLIERVALIQHENICPDELKEAISSLMFASSRCGEFPELTELRAVLTARFGKEFVARAVELRNNCGVNPKMIQKLSTRQPTLESKMNVLKDIASENGITLNLEEDTFVKPEEKFNKVNQSEDHNPKHADVKKGDETQTLYNGIIEDERISSPNSRRKYKDVADAAEEAFRSAAYAAAAARAAVELSRSGPSGSHGTDDHGTREGQNGDEFNSKDEKESSKVHHMTSELNTGTKPEINELHMPSSAMGVTEVAIRTNPLGQKTVFDNEGITEERGIKQEIRNELQEQTATKLPRSSQKQMSSTLTKDPVAGSGMQSQGLETGRKPVSVRKRR